MPVRPRARSTASRRCPQAPQKTKLTGTSVPQFGHARVGMAARLPLDGPAPRPPDADGAGKLGAGALYGDEVGGGLKDGVGAGSGLWNAAGDGGAAGLQLGAWPSGDGPGPIWPAITVRAGSAPLGAPPPKAGEPAGVLGPTGDGWKPPPKGAAAGAAG